MKAKHAQRAVPPLAEILAPDRNLLTQAYKAGLILGWKHDPERGVRVAVANRLDEYVELTYLSRYLAKLRDVSAHWSSTCQKSLPLCLSSRLWAARLAARSTSSLPSSGVARPISTSLRIIALPLLFFVEEAAADLDPVLIYFVQAGWVSLARVWPQERRFDLTDWHTYEQLATFLERAEAQCGRRERVLFLLYSDAGLRPGEGPGIRWEDFDAVSQDRAGWARRDRT
jgi:integrase